jgi:HNH endonuclease
MVAAKIVETFTLDRLHQVLRYDPATGVFMWLEGRRKGKKAGSQKADGYVRIEIDGESYTASRLAWFYVTGAWPSNQIDHKDRCRSNNTWANLRPATHKQNQENKRTWASSGARGVEWFKGKWQATIKHNKQKKYLGRFDNIVDAFAARLCAERQLFTHSV